MQTHNSRQNFKLGLVYSLNPFPLPVSARGPPVRRVATLHLCPWLLTGHLLCHPEGVCSLGVWRDGRRWRAVTEPAAGGLEAALALPEDSPAVLLAGNRWRCFSDPSTALLATSLWHPGIHSPAGSSCWEDFNFSSEASCAGPPAAPGRLSAHLAAHIWLNSRPPVGAAGRPPRAALSCSRRQSPALLSHCLTRKGTAVHSRL